MLEGQLGKSKETLKLIYLRQKKDNFIDLDCYLYTASSNNILKVLLRDDMVLATSMSIITQMFQGRI